MIKDINGKEAVDITVKVNGKLVDPSEFSKETWAKKFGRFMKLWFGVMRRYWRRLNHLKAGTT